MISQSRKRHGLWSKSNILATIAIGLFTILAIIVGALIINFRSLKSSEICLPTFKQMLKSPISFSSKPIAVAVGDLNNDNQIDIIVPNTDTNTIGIFIAKGNGSFADQTTYFTGDHTYPCSIVIDDFNNDTYLDIVVANYGINSIGIFLGNRNGTFSDQKLFSLGSSHPAFVRVGDFNNDHRLDIVVVNYGTNNIGVLLGNGDGSFQDQITYFTGYDSIPCSLAVGHFNNDYKLDIAIVNFGTNNIDILLGYGNGSFGNQQTYSTYPKSNPTSIALGDFNHDNILDIVVTNKGSGNIAIFFGYGNGTFQPQTIYPISSNSYPQYVALGHFNKDSQLDIVIVDSINNEIYILPGNENGTFPIITKYDMTSGSSPVCAAVADFNNDNQSDIVVANYGTNNILVLMEYSIKPSAESTNYYQSGIPSGTDPVAVGDFNNDHILDIVFSANSDISILTGLGNGTFNSDGVYSIGHGDLVAYICVGDLNNDNQIDIVIADVGSDIVGIFLGHGTGNFSTMMNYSTGIGSQPWWVTLGDVNNDNRLDIVSANTGTNSIGIFLGNGDGTFATMTNYSTGSDSQPYSVAVGKINNDNYLDIVAANWYNGVVVFLGYGNGTFSFIFRYSTSTDAGTFTVALADFNRDNHLDIVVSNTLANNIGVFLGYGNGTFASEQTYSTGSNSQPYYAIVANFNNDNISDIAVTNYGIGEVVIFYGYGNGSFELARTYPTGSGSKPYGIITVDFDNNKNLEIVVALSGTGAIVVLTEYYAADFVDQITYSTGSAAQPFSVAVGDFNNDNRSDVVVANSGTGNLSILLGSGNGTFGMEMMYLIGADTYPQYVITCDINRDNHLDIVSVNSKNNSISVIMGYGNGSFANQLMYSTGDGSHPYAIASGDLNNDNRLDLVTANKDTDDIGIFYGFDYTSFQSQEIYSSIDNSGMRGIVVSDFNNDNFLDIGVVFFNNNTLGILLGYGNSSFGMMMIYSTGNDSQPFDIAVGDFNKDDRMDIVVANLGSNSVGILLGYGNGSFSIVEIYSTKDSSPISVSVGDFNNDDRLDIVVANYGTNSIGVLLGDGNGSFSIVKIYSTEDLSKPYSISVGDFNNDGRLDVVITNAGAANDGLGVFLGYGDGSFQTIMTYAMNIYSYETCVTVGDFNNDNKLDIAFSDGNDGWIGILLGYGNGSFASIKTFVTGSGSSPTRINVGDFNKDNNLDIAVVNSGINNIVVLFGYGDGTFLLGKAYSTENNSNPYALAIGDFNRDNRLDIVVTTLVSNDISIFFGYGHEPFAGMISINLESGSKPYSVAIDDLNNDGRLDIVVANYGNNNVGILLGLGDRSFGSMMTYSMGTGSGPYCVAVGDFNNDHQLDIVVTNSEADNITILLGFGNGTFGNLSKYSTGLRSRPYIVTIGDLDNNNKSYLVIANSGTNNVFVLHGDGSFVNGTSYPLDYGSLPYSVAVTDLNGDNNSDIVIACYGTDHVETLVKTC